MPVLRRLGAMDKTWIQRTFLKAEEIAVAFHMLEVLSFQYHQFYFTTAPPVETVSTSCAVDKIMYYYKLCSSDKLLQ